MNFKIYRVLMKAGCDDLADIIQKHDSYLYCWVFKTTNSKKCIHTCSYKINKNSVIKHYSTYYVYRPLTIVMANTTSYSPVADLGELGDYTLPSLQPQGIQKSQCSDITMH